MPARHPCANCGRLVLPRRKCACHGQVYDTAWRAHSEKRRAQQPWCSDCGTPDDLTVDHPTDDVVCRSCNSARGHTTIPHRKGEGRSNL